MKRKIIFLIIYFTSPLLPILAIYTANPDRYSDISILMPMILGSLAYTWLTAEFIISARPKWVECYFGLDKFYQFHGMMALVSIVLVFIHKVIEEMVMGIFLTSIFGNWAFFIFLGIVILAAFFMTDSYLRKIKPLVTLKKYLERIRIAKYELQRLIHNLSFIGLTIMFIHVLMTTSSRTSIWVRMIYIGYFSAGTGFYVYHKILKRYVVAKKYVVSDVIFESPQLLTLRMAPQNGKMIHYKPGQFGFVRIFGTGIKPEEHPFSISSAPINQEYLDITIKELGDYTATLKNVKPGYTAILDAPYGRFSYLNYPLESSTVFLAGGVGITPVISILRHMADQDCDKKVLLFWGVNTAAELAFQHELDQMIARIENFVYIPVVLNDETWNGEKGMIDRAMIEMNLMKNGMKPESCGFYICGPLNMMKAMVGFLKTMGIPKKRIHFERFSL